MICSLPSYMIIAAGENVCGCGGVGGEYIAKHTQSICASLTVRHAPCERFLILLVGIFRSTTDRLLRVRGVAKVNSTSIHGFSSVICIECASAWGGEVEEGIKISDEVNFLIQFGEAIWTCVCALQARSLRSRHPPHLLRCRSRYCGFRSSRVWVISLARVSSPYLDLISRTLRLQMAQFSRCLPPTFLVASLWASYHSAFLVFVCLFHPVYFALLGLLMKGSFQNTGVWGKDDQRSAVIGKYKLE